MSHLSAARCRRGGRDLIRYADYRTGRGCICYYENKAIYKPVSKALMPVKIYITLRARKLPKFPFAYF